MKAVATFEAAARHESFKGAGEELSLTPSAISHQVRQLEEHLGVKLFHRLGGGLAITGAGSAYLKTLSPVFSKIDDATKQVMQLEYSDQLTVRSAPSFAGKWLLDRLPDFLEKYPDIDVKVLATSELLDFRKKKYRCRNILWPVGLAGLYRSTAVVGTGSSHVQPKIQE